MIEHKKIMIVSMVFIVMFAIGCVEDNQPETQPIQPTIQPTEEKQYTQIFTSGTLTVQAVSKL